MKKAPSVDTRSTGVGAPAGMPPVLAVSPSEGDHRALRSILESSGWILYEAHDLASALALLPQLEAGVVLCDQFLPRGTWIDLLDRIRPLTIAPSFIVASRCADERLWAEALNLGAWDVLQKPFRRSEVLHAVRSGSEQWLLALERASKPLRAVTAAGGF